MSVLETIRRTLRRYQLVTPQTRVVVALSGGPDSVALLHLLHALHAEGVLQLAGVAHFNHQLRDEASRDEQYCRDAAASCGLPIVVDRADIREQARRDHRSLDRRS